MAAPARKVYLDGLVDSRVTAQAALRRLVEQRDAWIAEQRRTASAPADEFALKVERMIESQAASKGFISK